MPRVYYLQLIGLLGFKTTFEQCGDLRCPVVGLVCRKTGQRLLIRLGESRHAIAPGFLGSVKRLICHGNQRESGRFSRGENRGHAQADGQMIGKRLCLGGDVERFDCAAQSRHHHRGAGQIGLRQNDRELFATVPRQKIIRPL